MYDIEASVGFLLAKVYQRGYALFKSELDPYGITPQQFSLLAFLWLEDGLSQSELSGKTQIDRSTMGGLIDRLEKIGLVIRQPHPEDRRAYRIILTERGKELQPELCHLASKIRDQFTSPLSPDECANLRGLLEKLRG